MSDSGSTGESVALPTAVAVPTWITLNPGLSDGAVRTWTALAYIHEVYGEAKLSFQDLGDFMGISGRAAFNRVKELREVGALSSERQTDATANVYTLHHYPHDGSKLH